MTTSAIIMMIVAMLTLWGGLIAAAINLVRREDLSATDKDVYAAELQRDL